MIRIGIGFGNARTRVYISGTKCSDVLAFDESDDTPWIPTAVRCYGGDRPALCGYPALYGSGGKLYTDLKSGITNGTAYEREKSKEMIPVFFRYIYLTFEGKRMFFGGGDEALYVAISVPSGWDEETCRFISGALDDAGFGENIHIKPCAQTAAEALPVLKMSQITRHFSGKDTLHMLAVKLGHSALDCASLRVDTRTNAVRVMGGESLYRTGFVAAAIDEKLREYLLMCMARAGLPDQEADELWENPGVQQGLCRWKENIVLPKLSANVPVEECSFLMAYSPLVKRPLHLGLSRNDFQEWCENALCETLQAITRRMAALPEPVDVFLIYGGNTCWIEEKVAVLPQMSRMVLFNYGEDAQRTLLRALTEDVLPVTPVPQNAKPDVRMDTDSVIRGVCSACYGCCPAGVHVIDKPDKRIDLSVLPHAVLAAKMGFRASGLPPVYGLIALKNNAQSLDGMLLITGDGLYKWRKGLHAAKVYSWTDVKDGTKLNVLCQGETAAVFIGDQKLLDCGIDLVPALQGLLGNCMARLKIYGKAE